MNDFKHVPVLLTEAIDYLNIKPSGIYVDCTLGGGGHTQKILNILDKSGHLYSLDQDQNAINYNKIQLSSEIENNKLTLIKGNFRNIKRILNGYSIKKVDGFIYDLGVSSSQFDVAQRGFSYKLDAPLDMRMDQQQSLTAEIIVNKWSYNDLVRIFFQYGEEKFSKSIARQIEKVRIHHHIRTTLELVDIIKKGIPARARRSGGHPAKRVFQALRIVVNDELNSLMQSLITALDMLNVDGRIGVITFHSLEDRIVKQLFMKKSHLFNIPRDIPMILEEQKPKFQLINKKPIIPSDNEIFLNHRSHSAKLRVIQKL